MGNLQLAPGSLFANRFEIQRAAGSGGMGTVYRTTDRYSGDTVALKLLNTERVASGGDEGERFAREAQLLSELGHPGIVSHVAHGQTPDGQRFLAMEWLEGQDLGERLLRGPLPVLDSLRLLEQVADALSVAHQRGIIHRDLKPANLFLIGGDVGRVKILDFGIARRIATSHAMTKTGMVIGTPEYMAPEQARGSRDITPAADLFSLGCVLYECLTGQPPFVADHIAAVLVRILFEEPVPVEERRPGVPTALAALLGRLLAKVPGQRVADAAALRTEILSLGEMSEPALAATVASPTLKTESFADQEQSLFSIVLAAPAEQDIGVGATMPGSAVQPGAEDRQAMLQALAGFGGSPDFLANGTLVVTVPSLGSAQDQAVRAARAALLIKERWPDAVVSMATGRGAVRGRTAVGEVVELATRPLKIGSHPSVTRPTTGVMIDPLSAKLLAGRFAQTPQPDGALLLHEERDLDASRPLLGKPTPCLGREPELAILEAQLSACIEESEARVVLLTAPPGAGKSRLRHEFLRRIEKRSEPITLLLGRGDMMSAGAPYGILRSAIHRLCGISGSEPLDTQRERLRTRISQNLADADLERTILFVGELCSVPFPDDGKPMLQAARKDPKIMRDCLRQGFLVFLAAECKAAPVLLVLDDLQWGDELTISVLDEALREQAGTPLFVLSLARPEVHEAFPKLYSGHKVQEIPLKGLSKKACERLITQVLGKDVAPDTVARVIEQAGGNALFLEELIRSIAEAESESQPETVLAMLQARLGRLDAGVRRVVRAASIFGQTFWRGGVAAVLGLVTTAPEVKDWLSALIDAELVQPHAQSRLANESEYGFRHALVRDAAYGLLTEEDQRRGHRLAASSLERMGETDPMILAEHCRAGHLPEQAIQRYIQAADLTLANNDPDATLLRARRGLACDPRGEARGALRYLECQAIWTADPEAAFQAGIEALDLLTPGSQRWCRTLMPLFFITVLGGQYQRAGMLIHRFRGADPADDAVCAWLEAASVLVSGFSLRDPKVSRAFLSQMEAMAGRIPAGDWLSRGYLSVARHFAARNYGSDPWATWVLGQEAYHALEEAGAMRSWVLLAATWAYVYAELGDPKTGEALGRRALAEAKRLRDPVLISRAQIGMVRLCAMLGTSSAHAEAETLANDLLTGTMLDPLFEGMLRGFLARVYLAGGDHERALALGCRSCELLRAFPVLRCEVIADLSRILIAKGETRTARELTDEGIGQLAAIGGGFSELAIRLAAAEARDADGDHGGAVEALRDAARALELRSARIPDPEIRERYLTRIGENVRIRERMREWTIA